MTVKGSDVERQVTCVVVDERRAIVASLDRCLSACGFVVLGSAESAGAAEDLLSEVRPAAVVIGSVAAGRRGTAIELAVSARGRAIESVVYFEQISPIEVRHALEADVRGFVSMTAELDEVVSALKVVLDGGTYIDPTLAPSLINLIGTPTYLTPRERDILTLLAAGVSTRGIAAEMGVSMTTIRSHLKHAMARLGTKSTVSTVAAAVRQRLID